ncbi:unnamed protein product [Durusdinium trenchii]|uniref:Uncharacterized protein n=1 Tax=Durusdinium trenchii TaxID=1381693 RepID=A0ABP0HW25_9DINO
MAEHEHEEGEGSSSLIICNGRDPESIQLLCTFLPRGRRTHIVQSSETLSVAHVKPCLERLFQRDGIKRIFYVGPADETTNGCAWAFDEPLTLNDILSLKARNQNAATTVTIYADYTTKASIQKLIPADDVTVFSWCSWHAEESKKGQGLTYLVYANLGLREEVMQELSSVYGPDGTSYDDWMPLQGLGLTNFEASAPWLGEFRTLALEARHPIAVYVAATLRKIRRDQTKFGQSKENMERVRQVIARIKERLDACKYRDTGSDGADGAQSKSKDAGESACSGTRSVHVKIVGIGDGADSDELDDFDEIFESVEQHHTFWTSRGCRVSSMYDSMGWHSGDVQRAIRELHKSTSSSQAILVVVGVGGFPDCDLDNCDLPDVPSGEQFFAWRLADGEQFFFRSGFCSFWNDLGSKDIILFSDSCYGKLLCEEAARLNAACIIQATSGSHKTTLPELVGLRDDPETDDSLTNDPDTEDEDLQIGCNNGQHWIFQQQYSLTPRQRRRWFGTHYYRLEEPVESDCPPFHWYNPSGQECLTLPGNLSVRLIGKRVEPPAEDERPDVEGQAIVAQPSGQEDWLDGLHELCLNRPTIFTMLESLMREFPEARNPQLFQVLRDELKGSTMRDGPQKEEPSDLIEALEHLRVDLKLRRRFAKDIVEAFIEELE